MIGGFVRHNLGALQDWLGRARRADVAGDLSKEVARIIEEGNREGILAGTDAEGKPFADLAPSTIRRGRGGFGPPTAPRNSASQVIDRFRVVVEKGYGNEYVVRASWPGATHIRFFATGAKYRAGSERAGQYRTPIRNVVGIRPATMRKLEEATGRAAINFFGRV